MSQSNILKSFTFVIIQFSCLGLIAITGPIFPGNKLLLAVEFLGLALGSWAVFVMGIGNFNVTPDPLKSSRLVTRGPYRFIRHPMYLALLLVTLPLVATKFSVLRLAIWLVLFIDLVVKLNYEEGILMTRLEGYRDYKQRSYHLIPFIY
ncbi:MAG: methyltransferase family protein [Anaerolineales bacterium]